MPFVRVICSGAVEEALLPKLSALLARELGKPEAYVMTCLETGARMTFAGTAKPCCFVEVKNVGVLTGEVTKRVSAALTDFLAPALGVEEDRVYIVFSEVKPQHWGFDGGTFG
ncbi:MAG TPA: phenylpyruvate tautomerase MIF-related protein [Polyangia bacterium]|jgi:phenylpyruvate tautomerase PptA (4-oxalocrotonate tautomerase family)